MLSPGRGPLLPGPPRRPFPFVRSPFPALRMSGEEGLCPPCLGTLDCQNHHSPPAPSSLDSWCSSQLSGPIHPTLHLP